MPLYLSNTNRIESLQGDSGGAGKGTNSTTTTTLTPPDYQWVWSRNAPGTVDVTNNFTFNYTKNSLPDQTDYDVIGTGSIFLPQGGSPVPESGSQGIGVDWQGNVSFVPSGSMWRAPVGPDFEVKPDVFGKLATFENTNEFGTYMLASYIAWSSSYMTFEFVPPSSSIQRCVTYPAYTYFTQPITGSDDTTTWLALLSADKFGADCGYSTPCFCDLCYNNSGQNGDVNIINQTSPCTGSILPTTTTSTTTTSTTTTSTTTTSTTTTSTTTSTTTTTAAPYDVDFLLVAGGGGGGGDGGGGGGGGQFISASYSVAPNTTYDLTVGLGGSGSVTPQVSGSQGQSSTIFGNTAVGGGGGGSVGNIGGVGANGGGGSYNASGSAGTAGFNGGTGVNNATGGGAGAGANGLDGILSNPRKSGNGGNGLLWVDGNYYAGGGGGGEVNQAVTSSVGLGGLGGGGSAVLDDSGLPGTVNTGGGGGGASNQSNLLVGGNGGSGIVIIRYSGSQRGSGGVVTSSGGFTYHTFASSSAYVA
jgi:hypothetical protein